MPLTSVVARQLCTRAELQIFTESLVRNVKNLDLKSVKTRVARARKLRDKYSGLADQQAREIRGKQPPRRSRIVQRNENTRKKAQLFQEALTRFEKHREVLEALPAKTRSTKKQVKKAVKKIDRKSTTKETATSNTAKKKKTGTKSKKVVKRKSTAASSKTRGAKAKSSRFTAAGQTRIQKHVSARNRRQQAKRDSR